PSAGAPGGESIAEVARRALGVVHRIERRHRNGNVLLVAHKTVLRVLTCALLDIELRRYRDWITQPVCGLTIVDGSPSGYVLRALDDLGHLPPWLRERALRAGRLPGLPLDTRPDGTGATRGDPGIGAELTAGV